MEKNEFLSAIRSMTTCPLILKDSAEYYEKVQGSGKSCIKKVKEIVATLKWRMQFEAKLADQAKKVAYNKAKPKTDKAAARTERRKNRLLVWEEGKKFRRLDKQYRKNPAPILAPSIVY